MELPQSLRLCTASAAAALYLIGHELLLPRERRRQGGISKWITYAVKITNYRYDCVKTRNGPGLGS